MKLQSKFTFGDRLDTQRTLGSRRPQSRLRSQLRPYIILVLINVDEAGLGYMAYPRRGLMCQGSRPQERGFMLMHRAEGKVDIYAWGSGMHLPSTVSREWVCSLTEGLDFSPFVSEINTLSVRVGRRGPGLSLPYRTASLQKYYTVREEASVIPVGRGCTSGHKQESRHGHQECCKRWLQVQLAHFRCKGSCSKARSKWQHMLRPSRTLFGSVADEAEETVSKKKLLMQGRRTTKEAQHTQKDKGGTAHSEGQRRHSTLRTRSRPRQLTRRWLTDSDYLTSQCTIAAA
eukprot:365932-Chlamydomonas_euryale.AAC.12